MHSLAMVLLTETLGVGMSGLWEEVSSQRLTFGHCCLFLW